MSALRTAKKNFLRNPSSFVRSPRQFWSAYYSLQPNCQRIPVHLKNGPITADSPQSKCDLLNSCFISAFSPISSVPSQTTLTQEFPRLDTISCSSEDVCQLLNSLPSKTVAGPDEISSQMLKIAAGTIAPQLSALFNLSLSTGTVPTAWKLSNVTPVYKAGDPPVLQPITALSPISIFAL